MADFSTMEQMAEPKEDSSFDEAEKEDNLLANNEDSSQQSTGDHKNSTQHIDKEEVLNHVKREFHNGRCLHVKYLPQDATEEDIQQLLKDVVEIKQIHLNKRTRTAKVIIESPIVLENWPSENNFSIGDQSVKVTPSLTEHVLCVAHLPLIFTEEDFQNLVQMYGPLTRCFLMKSEITGHSKGYGFVEYATKEVAHQARSLLEWKTIGNCTLHCDWLLPSHITYKSLHSTCLFVDHLPPDFHDVNQLRETFSIIVKPLYCQIVSKNRESLGIGLVEFNTSEEAEETQQKLNGFQMEKHKIRVTFCIPGMHAVTVFNKLTSENGPHGKKPLLPDPVINPALMNQLQVLAMQNPQFFQNLQSIVVAQLQSLQNNNQVHRNYQNKKNKSSSGLLGNPPSLNSNPNVQAAALLLLATQTQMRLQQPSLMGNPFLLSQLQNLVQHDNSRMTSQGGAVATAEGLQSFLKQLGVNTSMGHGNSGYGMALSPQAAKVPLVQNNSFGQNIRNVEELRTGREFSQVDNHGFAKTGKTALLPNPNGFDAPKGLLPTPGEISSPAWSPTAIDTHSNSNTQWDSHTSFSDSLNCNRSTLFNENRLKNSSDNNSYSDSPIKNGSFHSRTPLLGDRPKNFNGVHNKMPLLGDKPALSSNVNLSPASSISSLTGEISDSGIAFHSSLLTNDSSGMNKYNSSHLPNGGSGYNIPHHANSDSLPNKGIAGMKPPQSLSLFGLSNRSNTSSPMSNGLLPPPGVKSGYGGGYNRNNSFMSANTATPNNIPPNPHSFDPNNLSQLNSQLEKLGNNPLINLLLQAAQTNNVLPSQTNERNDADNDMFENTRRLPNANSVYPSTDSSFLNQRNYNPGLGSSELSPPSKPSLLGCPPSQNDYMDSRYNSFNSSSNQKNSLLGDYPASNMNYSSHRKGAMHSTIGQKRKFHSLLPSPEESPDGSYVGQHSQGLGGHYADSYFKRFRK